MCKDFPKFELWWFFSNSWLNKWCAGHLFLAALGFFIAHWNLPVLLTLFMSKYPKTGKCHSTAGIWPWILTWPMILTSMTFKVSCCIVGIVNPVVQLTWDQRDMNRSWTRYTISTFDPIHDLDLKFLKSNYDIAVIQEWVVWLTWEKVIWINKIFNLTSSS